MHKVLSQIIWFSFFLYSAHYFISFTFRCCTFIQKMSFHSTISTCVIYFPILCHFPFMFFCHCSSFLLFYWILLHLYFWNLSFFHLISHILFYILLELFSICSYLFSRFLFLSYLSCYPISWSRFFS